MTAILSSSHSLPDFQEIATKLPKADPLPPFRYDPSRTVVNETASIKMSEQTHRYIYKKEDPTRFIFSKKEWKSKSENSEKEKSQEKKSKIPAKILRPLEFVNQLKIRQNMSYTGLVIEGTSETVGPGLLTFANGEHSPVFFCPPGNMNFWQVTKEKKFDKWLKVCDLQLKTMKSNLLLLSRQPQNNLDESPLPADTQLNGNKLMQ